MTNTILLLFRIGMRHLLGLILSATILAGLSHAEWNLFNFPRLEGLPSFFLLCFVSLLLGLFIERLLVTYHTQRAFKKKVLAFVDSFPREDKEDLLLFILENKKIDTSSRLGKWIRATAPVGMFKRVLDSDASQVYLLTLQAREILIRIVQNR